MAGGRGSGRKSGKADSRRSDKDDAEREVVSAPQEGDAIGICGLCGRDMVAGPSVEAHHLIPRSHGGRETVTLHTICHRRIHAALSERELARSYATLEALRAHPDIAAFINWVARRPPEFMSEVLKARR